VAANVALHRNSNANAKYKGGNTGGMDICLL